MQKLIMTLNRIEDDRHLLFITVSVLRAKISKNG